MGCRNTFQSSGLIFISLLFLYSLIPYTAYTQHQDVIPNAADPAAGTLHVIAVMAEFQPDDNRFTSGNGTFEPGSIPYLENPGTNIDALPHDRQYFEAHLEFIQNYFDSMSGSQFNIEFTVLPDIYRLPHEMSYYSPLGESPELNSLAEMASDTWSLVDASTADLSAIQPGDNIAFVIFHAGVGRDIELTGTLLDRTPQDIPSVYLSRDALSDLLEESDFEGFPLQNSSISVTNSLIIPRTLSRSGEDVSGNRFVLPLSINGMLAFQVASHLGLPPLFNTETGRSGIGRFGLMDGAGIFAYNGLFPPRMSAWEKTYLGWAEPFDVNPRSEQEVRLTYSSPGTPGSIARIPMSESEYYLVENRHRDPIGNGIEITIRQPGGEYITQTFSNTDTLFTQQQSGFADLLEPGVVTQVSHYDFALPGGLIRNRQLNGGILIWHIDESVITQKLSGGGVNNDPDRRGVSLVEADGARDIGRPVQIGLFENEINGSPFDFWWNGNDATSVTPSGEITLYENRFGPDTTPQNRTNSGSVAAFELYNFSDNLAEASFQIRPVSPYDNLYRLSHQSTISGLQASIPSDSPYYRRYPLSLIPDRFDYPDLILIPGVNGLLAYRFGSNSFTEPFHSGDPIRQPLFYDEHRILTATLPDDPNTESELTALEIGDPEMTILFENSVAEPWSMMSLTQSGMIDFDGSEYRLDTETNQITQTVDQVQFRTDSQNGYRAEIRQSELVIHTPEGTVVHSLAPFSDSNRIYAGLIQRAEKPDVYLVTDHEIHYYPAEDQYSRSVKIAEENLLNRPAVADLTGDGEPDFIFISPEHNRVQAINRNGAVISSFPIMPPPGVRLTGTPLMADLTGNGDQDLIITGSDGYSLNLFFYNQQGELIEGSPLYAGGNSEGDADGVHPVLFESGVAAMSPDGDFRIWELPQLRDIRWASPYGNSTRYKATSVVGDSDPGMPAFSLLNREETYNWPNPARDETHIRFQTSEAAEVTIRIMSYSGRTLYDRTVQSRGGLPEEIAVDTSGWASGGYFAVIRARLHGQTEQKRIHIAIAR
jgi:hypothetical protein